MAGTLYLVATPIGNLGDISARAVEVLRNADLIAAEDTRNTIRLLNHFEIHTPMTAYHEYNRFDKADELVRQLLEGKTVACVTDAGMPGISDPGEVLVEKARAAGIFVTCVPGPNAALTALVISGLPARRFRFEGFLPEEKKEAGPLLEELKQDTATLIFYEAPHRLKKTVGILLEALGDRKSAFCRELTKVHEEVKTMTLSEAAAYYEENAPRGEFVVIVEGADPESARAREALSWQELSIAEHVAFYEKAGLDRKDAMKRAAEDRQIPKRAVYQALLDEKQLLF